jgi:hypothetical protein
VLKFGFIKIRLAGYENPWLKYLSILEKDFSKNFLRIEVVSRLDYCCVERRASLGVASDGTLVLPLSVKQVISLLIL